MVPMLLAQLSGEDKTENKTVWWSLRPLQSMSVPTVPQEQQNWVRSPIDAFIIAKLQDKGLSPAPEADKRTLIRRLTYNLHGLPPTQQEVKQFIEDTSSQAYEKLVDRLLASPRYGERWARHWLDVVHYADSHGQDQDRPRPNAWPYRDYLIRNFNADTPYAQMIKEQIAGDVLYPENPSAIAATGFLAAGPWDESGLMGIREDSLDRQIAHYLDRDDIVTSTMSTIAGATVHCARCHDHKFDPFTQADYYSLQAVFAGIDKAERTYDADSKIHRQRMQLNAELEQVRGLKGKVDPALLTKERQDEVKAWESRWITEQLKWETPTLLEVSSSQGSLLRPLLDRSIIAIGKRPEKDTYTIKLGTELPKISSLRLEVLCDESLPHQGPGRCDNGNLHLSEVRITATPRGKNNKPVEVKVTKAVADFDQEGWGISRAIDGDEKTAWGIYPQVSKPHQVIFTFDQPVCFAEGTLLAVELKQLHGGGHLIGRFRLSVHADPNEALPAQLPSSLAGLFSIPTTWRTEAQRAELTRLIWIERLTKELARLPAPLKVYCGTNQFAADGSFKPAPLPRPVHLLKRGEITRPGNLASPAGLAAISLPFVVNNPANEGSRRAALAEWLVHPENPLTWRTMVNRVWHYHFGKGLVETPNDLGKMGGTPSHPELLDWLANEFRRTGSLKQLHRLILNSSVYRQSTRHDPKAALVDGDNRLLWRMNRHRLDAESVRDSILSITDRLDATMYGPPVKHFEMKPGIHVTPLADYDKFDVDSADSRRRSIYRYLFRTRPDPLLAALDCPDASQSAPVRGSSIGALQALALWNNKFTLRYAGHLAAIGTKASTDVTTQIQTICQRVYYRTANEQELTDWAAYVRQHGLANWCRVLFNSSEFLFVE